MEIIFNGLNGTIKLIMSNNCKIRPIKRNPITVGDIKCLIENTCILLK